MKCAKHKIEMELRSADCRRCENGEIEDDDPMSFGLPARCYVCGSTGVQDFWECWQCEDENEDD